MMYAKTLSNQIHVCVFGSIFNQQKPSEFYFIRGSEKFLFGSIESSTMRTNDSDFSSAWMVSQQKLQWQLVADKHEHMKLVRKQRAPSKRDLPRWRTSQWPWSSAGTGGPGPAAGCRSPAGLAGSASWGLGDPGGRCRDRARELEGWTWNLEDRKFTWNVREGGATLPSAPFKVTAIITSQHCLLRPNEMKTCNWKVY